MSSTLILNATLVNEGEQRQQDLLIKNGKIEKIGADLQGVSADEVIDGAGCWLIPGMIDDQVHFREPGLTHKADIGTESRAAVAGGITSYMEMPNVMPPTLNVEALENKFAIAARKSSANYSFYMGTSNSNIEAIKAIDPTRVCGVKVFMGASTGNLLVDDPVALENIFRESPILVATHCEDSPMIDSNVEEWHAKNSGPMPIFEHPNMRSREACYASSSMAVDLAKRLGTRLHVLHITTADELALFQAGPIESKQITAEACVHHLWFHSGDYEEKGNLIKCNPAVKLQSDRDAILQAVRDDVIDIIATDHAPHTWDEKNQPYESAPAGLPLVQDALLTLFDHVHEGRLSIERVVHKTAHAPALRYQVKDRGFLREGYAADVVLVRPEGGTDATKERVLSKCGWSPFSPHRFSAKIESTWVNGVKVFDGESVSNQAIDAADALVFDR